MSRGLTRISRIKSNKSIKSYPRYPRVSAAKIKFILCDCLSVKMYVNYRKSGQICISKEQNPRNACGKYPGYLCAGKKRSLPLFFVGAVISFAAILRVINQRNFYIFRNNFYVIQFRK